MFTVTSNLLSKSGLSADQLDALLQNKGVLSGLGSAFAAVEKKYGVNAIFGIAQACLESGNGTSLIATQKHNIFGITAYDENPYGDASTFDSAADCIGYWGSFISSQYLSPSGAYFVSTTPTGVARHWASDPNYATKIVALMNQLALQAGQGNVTESANAGPIQNQTATKTYIVKRGDNMWQIATDNGLTLAQLESMNPQAGHPAGSFSVIWPGDVLALGVPLSSQGSKMAGNKTATEE